MTLITLSHFSSHGPWAAFAGNSIVSDVILSIFQIGGEVGVNCFVLISGYYLIEAGFKTRSAIRIVKKSLLYSWMCLLLSIVLLNKQNSALSIAKGLFPITGSEYWFITAYIALYVTSPFIARGAKALGALQWRRLLIVLFIMLSCITLLPISKTIVSDYTWFVFLFLLSGYFRIFGFDRMKDKLKHLTMLSLGFQLSTSIAFVLLSHGFAQLEMLDEHSFYFKAMNMLPEFILSLGLFAFFLQKRETHNALTNVVAGHVLAAYLITDNPLIRSELWAVFSSLYGNPIALLIAGVLISCMIVLFAALIDIICSHTIGRLVDVLLENSFGKLFDRIDDWYCPGHNCPGNGY